MRSTAFLLVLATLGCASLAAASTDDLWSAPVDGIRGRIILEAGPDFNGRGTTRVYLEIQNIGRDSGGLPTAIWFDPTAHQFQWRLIDESGLPVPQTKAGAVIWVPPSYWIVIPFGGTLRFPVSVAGSYALGQVGGTSVEFNDGFVWLIPRGDRRAFFLNGSFSSNGPKREDSFAWSGTIALPSVRVPVKDE